MALVISLLKFLKNLLKLEILLVVFQELLSFLKLVNQKTLLW